MVRNLILCFSYSCLHAFFKFISFVWYGGFQCGNDAPLSATRMLGEVSRSLIIMAAPGSSHIDAIFGFSFSIFCSLL